MSIRRVTHQSNVDCQINVPSIAIKVSKPSTMAFASLNPYHFKSAPENSIGVTPAVSFPCIGYFLLINLDDFEYALDSLIRYIPFSPALSMWFARFGYDCHADAFVLM